MDPTLPCLTMSLPMMIEVQQSRMARLALGDMSPPGGAKAQQRTDPDDRAEWGKYREDKLEGREMSADRHPAGEASRKLPGTTFTWVDGAEVQGQKGCDSGAQAVAADH